MAYFMVGAPVVIGCAAIAVDVGLVLMMRAELQVSADASSQAAALQMMEYRTSLETGGQIVCGCACGNGRAA